MASSGFDPGGALRRILQLDAGGRELLADAVGKREVAGLLRFRALGDARLDRGFVERGSGLQETARALLQDAERCAQALEQRGRLRRARAVQLVRELEQH